MNQDLKALRQFGHVREIEPMIRAHRRLFPYGLYLKQNSRIIFDRNYRPIVECHNVGTIVSLRTNRGRSLIWIGKVEPANPCSRITFRAQQFFYSSDTPLDEVLARQLALVLAIPTIEAEIRRRIGVST